MAQCLQNDPLQNATLLTGSIIGTPNDFSTAIKPPSLPRPVISQSDSSYLSGNLLPALEQRPSYGGDISGRLSLDTAAASRQLNGVDHLAGTLNSPSQFQSQVSSLPSSTPRYLHRSSVLDKHNTMDTTTDESERVMERREGGQSSNDTTVHYIADEVEPTLLKEAAEFSLFEPSVAAYCGKLPSSPISNQTAGSRMSLGQQQPVSTGMSPGQQQPMSTGMSPGQQRPVSMGMSPGQQRPVSMGMSPKKGLKGNGTDPAAELLPYLVPTTPLTATSYDEAFDSKEEEESGIGRDSRSKRQNPFDSGSDQSFDDQWEFEPQNTESFLSDLKKEEEQFALFMKTTPSSLQSTFTIPSANASHVTNQENGQEESINSYFQGKSFPLGNDLISDSHHQRPQFEQDQLIVSPPGVPVQTPEIKPVLLTSSTSLTPNILTDSPIQTSVPHLDLNNISFVPPSSVASTLPLQSPVTTPTDIPKGGGASSATCHVSDMSKSSLITVTSKEQTTPITPPTHQQTTPITPSTQPLLTTPTQINELPSRYLSKEEEEETVNDSTLQLSNVSSLPITPAPSRLQNLLGTTGLSSFPTPSLVHDISHLYDLTHIHDMTAAAAGGVTVSGSTSDHLPETLPTAVPTGAASTVAIATTKTVSFCVASPQVLHSSDDSFSPSPSSTPSDRMSPAPMSPSLSPPTHNLSPRDTPLQQTTPSMKKDTPFQQATPSPIKDTLPKQTTPSQDDTLTQHDTPSPQQDDTPPINSSVKLANIRAMLDATRNNVDSFLASLKNTQVTPPNNHTPSSVSHTPSSVSHTLAASNGLSSPSVHQSVTPLVTTVGQYNPTASHCIAPAAPQSVVTAVAVNSSPITDHQSSDAIDIPLSGTAQSVATATADDMIQQSPQVCHDSSSLTSISSSDDDSSSSVDQETTPTQIPAVCSIKTSDRTTASDTLPINSYSSSQQQDQQQYTSTLIKYSPPPITSASTVTLSRISTGIQYPVSDATAVSSLLAVTSNATAVKSPLAVTSIVTAVKSPLAVTSNATAVKSPLAVTGNATAVKSPLAVTTAVKSPLANTVAVSSPLAVTTTSSTAPVALLANSGVYNLSTTAVVDMPSPLEPVTTTSVVSSSLYTTETGRYSPTDLIQSLPLTSTDTAPTIKQVTNYTHSFNEPGDCTQTSYFDLPPVTASPPYKESNHALFLVPSVVEVEAPNCVSFDGTCCVGGALHANVEVRNVSSRWIQGYLQLTSLQCNDTEVEHGKVFSFLSKCFIAPGKTEIIKVMFIPEQAGIYKGILQLSSSLTSTLLASVTLLATAEHPNVQFLTSGDDEKPLLLDFGTLFTSSNSTAVLPLFVVNHGKATVPLRLSLATSTQHWYCYSLAPVTQSLAIASTDEQVQSNTSTIRFSLPGKQDDQSGSSVTTLTVKFIPPAKSLNYTGAVEKCDSNIEVFLDSLALGGSTKLCTIPVVATVGVAKLCIPRSMQELAFVCALGGAHSQSIPLKNGGNVQVRVKLLVAGNGGQLFFTVHPETLELKPNQKQYIQVVYKPLATPTPDNNYHLMLNIEPSGPKYQIKLNCTVKEDQKDFHSNSNCRLECSEQCLIWAGTKLCSSSSSYSTNDVIIRNTGPAPVSLQLSVDNPDIFKIISPNTTSPVAVNPYQPLTVTVSFTPVSVNEVYNSSLTIMESTKLYKVRNVGVVNARVWFCIDYLIWVWWIM